MGSGAMIYITSFIKIDSAIRKWMGEGLHRQRQHGDRISLLSFLQNKEIRLKIQILDFNIYRHYSTPNKDHRAAFLFSHFKYFMHIFGTGGATAHIRFLSLFSHKKLY
jgi:hypothetical protein